MQKRKFRTNELQLIKATRSAKLDKLLLEHCGKKETVSGEYGACSIEELIRRSEEQRSQSGWSDEEQKC